MNNKLFLRMKLLQHKDVVETFVAYQRSENFNNEKGRVALVEQGYEETNCTNLLLPDGREVVEMFGKRWALRPEVHAERLAAAMEQARSRDATIAMEDPETAETKSVAGTDGLAEMLCPKCGDALQYSSVCGACAAGKAGYRHRYSCIHGHVDFVSKEKI